MKRFKFLFVSCFALLLLASGSISAQTKSDREIRIQHLLNSKNFTFVAESATPMGGGNIRLTSSNYLLSFYKDSLESFLPYFGAAFRPQYGTIQSPLIFTSSVYSFEAKTSKKGIQTLTIKVNTPDDIALLTLSVSPSGYGTLLVNSINRQPISFYGVVVPNPENAKDFSQNL